LADEVLPQKPLRQWVLSLPFAVRFLLGTDAEELTQVLAIVYRMISAYVLKKARSTGHKVICRRRRDARCGRAMRAFAVTAFWPYF
jgi:hypothetical protein